MEERDKSIQITRRIIGAAIEAPRHLGPGLLDPRTRPALAYELRQQGLKVEEQKSLPVV
jgi:GxxExxY protein